MPAVPAHVFCVGTGGDGERGPSGWGGGGTGAAHLAGRCTPGCEAPTGSSGPQRSSCSWSSCCTRRTGCLWGRPRTPARLPETGTRTRDHRAQIRLTLYLYNPSVPQREEAAASLASGPEPEPRSRQRALPWRRKMQPGKGRCLTAAAVQLLPSDTHWPEHHWQPLVLAAQL